MTIKFPSFNGLIIPLCFLALLCCPAVSVATNQQLTRLTVISCLMLLVKKNHDFEFQAHHWLFIAWIAWATLGTIFSEYPEMSFYGFIPYRVEGLLTWVIITCFGVLYWKVYNNLRPIAYTCLTMLLGLIIGYFLIVSRWKGHFGHIEHATIYFQRFFIPEVAIGSFAATCAPLLGIIFPLLPIFASIPIVLSASRSGLVSIVLWSAYPCYLWIKEHMTLQRFMGLLCALALMLLTSPLWFRYFHVADKLSKIPSIESVGLGARGHWIMEAGFLSERLPLQGYGLDTLSNYLTPPSNEEYKNLKTFIADKTHNIMFDILLETGWIGLTLILLCLGYAIGVCIKYPNQQNMACIYVIGSFITFGMANPNALLAQIVAVIALFGIRHPPSYTCPHYDEHFKTQKL